MTNRPMPRPALTKLETGRGETIARPRALSDSLERTPTEDVYEVIVALQHHLDTLLTEAEQQLVVSR